MLCPSARPEMPGSVVFGIVGGGEDAGRVAYLRQPVPATAEVVGLAGPVPATAVFRFGAGCEESACVHFDGADCRLAGRVVGLLPPVVEVLPPCAIRSQCRWWAQEGRAACVRCPAIATNPVEADERLRRAAQPSSSSSV